MQWEKENVTATVSRVDARNYISNAVGQPVSAGV